MKTKSIALSLLLMFVVVLGSYAQGFHFGAKGGVNMNKIAGRSFNDEFDYGFTLGGFAELNFTKKWGIQPELLWNQYKTKTSSSIDDIYQQGLIGQDITLNYISIPILLSYRPIPILSLQAGPQFGILVNQTQQFVYNVQDAFKKGDFSLLFGAQVNLAAFKAGLRYYIGLNNINDIDNADQWKNQGIQAYIGLRIF
jgi:hypothetical protein